MRGLIRWGVFGVGLGVCLSVFAVGIRDIRVGDNFNLQRAAEGRVSVQAVELDFAGNQVLVRHGSGGVEWVSPQMLHAQDTARQADATAEALEYMCQLDPALCGRPPASTNSGPVSSADKPYTDLRAPAKGIYGFSVENKCDVPVSVMLHFRDATNRWQVDGPWVVQPGDTKLLLNDRRETVLSKSDTFYFYARSTQGSYEWKGDQNVRTRAGQVYPMKLVKDSEGDSDLPLRCKG